MAIAENSSKISFISWLTFYVGSVLFFILQMLFPFFAFGASSWILLSDCCLLTSTYDFNVSYTVFYHMPCSDTALRRCKQNLRVKCCSKHLILFRRWGSQLPFMCFAAHGTSTMKLNCPRNLFEFCDMDCTKTLKSTRVIFEYILFYKHFVKIYDQCLVIYCSNFLYYLRLSHFCRGICFY